MSCRNVQFLIQAYVDGEASAGERGRVEQHVAECRLCARELEAMRQLRSLLAAPTGRAVSEGFEGRLHAGLSGLRPALSPLAWWERFCLRSEWRLRVPALFTAGSLAAALVAGVFTLRLQDARRDRQEFVATAVRRYEQLESADSKVNWDAVEASIDLNSGSVVTE